MFRQTKKSHVEQVITSPAMQAQPRPTTVALCGFFGHKNLGDDLMQLHLAAHIAAATPGGAEIRVFSDSASPDCGVESGVADNNAGPLSCDLIVIGGGSIISPEFWLFQNGGLARLAAPGAPRIAFVNVSLGPEVLTDIRWADTFPAALSSLNAGWWVRDHISYRALQDAGVKGKIVCLPDVAFTVQPHVATVYPARRTPLLPGTTRRCLVLLNSYSFNGLFPGPSSADALEKWLDAHRKALSLAHFMDWLTHWGFEVRFACAQVDRDCDDRIVSAFLYAGMVKKGAARWDDTFLPFGDLTREIAESDLVVSQRFHGTVLALASGVPVVTIGQHAKMRSLVEDWDQGPAFVGWESLTEDALVAATQAAESMDKASIALKVADVTQRWFRTEITDGWHATWSAWLQSH